MKKNCTKSKSREMQTAIDKNGNAFSREYKAYTRLYIKDVEDIFKIPVQSLRVFLFMSLGIDFQNRFFFDSEKFKKIQKLTGLNHDSISKAISDLMSLGIIKIIKNEKKDVLHTFKVNPKYTCKGVNKKIIKDYSAS